MPRSSTVEVDVDTRILDAMIRNMGGNASKGVRTVAFSIERKAKMKAPVDTGALRASIYVAVGRNTDGYSQARAEAVSKNGDVTTHKLPAPENEQTAHVGPSVEYAPALEFGSGRQGAQPYLVPAVRETESEMADAFEVVFEV